MTRDEAVSFIKKILGHRTIGDSDIVDFMQLAQINLESGPLKPWFLRSELSSITTDVGAQRVRVPTDFIMEAEDAVLEYVPSDTDEEVVPLTKGFMDELNYLYRGSEAAAPEAYALDGEYFRLYPTPDAAYTIRMVYFQKDTVLDTNVENNWLKHVPLLLMGETGSLYAPSLSNKNAIATFNQWRQQGMLLLQAQDEERKHVNMHYQIGGKV